MKCATANCSTAGELHILYSLVWPGAGRVLFCKPCFERAVQIAAILGLSVESLDCQIHSLGLTAS